MDNETLCWLTVERQRSSDASTLANTVDFAAPDALETRVVATKAMNTVIREPSGDAHMMAGKIANLH